MTFFVTFSKNFHKNQIKFFFAKLEILIFVVEVIRVLSWIANLSSKYDCSNLGSFRDMTCFIFIFFQKT